MGINTDVSTGRRAVAVNLGADTTGLSGVRAVYVGVAGDVKIDGQDGGTGVTFKAHPVGYLLVQPSKIYSTANGTTATDLVLIY
jgi:hypothetical protein